MLYSNAQTCAAADSRHKALQRPPQLCLAACMALQSCTQLLPPCSPMVPMLCLYRNVAGFPAKKEVAQLLFLTCIHVLQCPALTTGAKLSLPETGSHLSDCVECRYVRTLRLAAAPVWLTLAPEAGALVTHSHADLTLRVFTVCRHQCIKSKQLDCPCADFNTTAPVFNTTAPIWSCTSAQ